jgi:hypothetical protein
MAKPRYPQIKVTPVARDGNAFAIMGCVIQALAQHGVPRSEIRAFLEEAMQDASHAACGGWTYCFRTQYAVPSSLRRLAGHIGLEPANPSASYLLGFA